jgi:hypothetical protein
MGAERNTCTKLLNNYKSHGSINPGSPLQRLQDKWCRRRSTSGSARGCLFAATGHHRSEQSIPKFFWGFWQRENCMASSAFSVGVSSAPAGTVTELQPFQLLIDGRKYNHEIAWRESLTLSGTSLQLTRHSARLMVEMYVCHGSSFIHLLQQCYAGHALLFRTPPLSANRPTFLPPPIAPLI